MLETIKQKIQELQHDDTSFHTYYQNFIMKTQDKNIEREFEYLNTNNRLSFYQLDRLIEKEMVNTNDNFAKP